jgi:hypothetical protein
MPDLCGAQSRAGVDGEHTGSIRLYLMTGKPDSFQRVCVSRGQYWAHGIGGVRRLVPRYNAGTFSIMTTVSRNTIYNSAATTNAMANE